MDASPPTIAYYKNDSQIGTTEDLTAAITYTPFNGNENSSTTKVFVYNFGSDSSFAANKTAQGNGGAGEDFYYTPPSGYKALCTDNLPTPLIALPGEYFNTIIYTGDGSSPSPTRVVGFQPDFVWTKLSDTAESHGLFDSVRGVQKQLRSNTNGAETSNAQTLLSFESTGFTSGSDTVINQNTKPYVAWNWKADGGAAVSKTYTVTTSASKFYLGGIQQPTLELREGSTYTFDTSDATVSGHTFKFATAADAAGSTEYTTGVTETGTPGSAGAKTVIVVAASAPALFYYCSNHSSMGGAANTPATGGSSNFDGTIASTVSANTTSGFSIVKYEGSGSATTVGHGLSVAPNMVIVKQYETAQGDGWPVYTSIVGNTKALHLENTDNPVTSINFWNSTTPTASVFSVFQSTETNESGKDYIAYCFHSVEGYSKVSSYTGNNNADGTFVYTGFRPAYIMFRRYDTDESWGLYDDKRPGYNVTPNRIYADSNSAQVTSSTSQIDMLSNGFKARSTGGVVNAAGTYLYIAFAQSPFKTSNAR